jgi:phosphoribosylformylglycinamidine synthase I
MKTQVVVIQFPGVNCEYETVRVLETVGLAGEVVRWNADPSVVAEAAAIVIPGGFSYQDRIRAGVVAAKDRVMDTVVEAASRGVPVMGICNGAQILVEAGAVTGFENEAIDLALAPNEMPDRVGYYCDWVRLKRGPAKCLFTEFMDDLPEDHATLPVPMAHGEGRFVTGNPDTAARLGRGEGVALLYANAGGETATEFPDNPNGSSGAIAGITNPAGNVLALMPHPERAAWMHQVPLRTGGAWAERRRSLEPGALEAPGPGRGFFESLKRAIA